MTDETQIVISRKTAIAAGLKYYYTGKMCLRGHLSPRYTKWASCVACNNALRSEYIERNRETYIANIKRGRVRWRKNNPLRVRFQAIKSGAKRRGIPFELEMEDIPTSEHCEACDVKLTLNGGPIRNEKMTIDRVDNAKGYVRGNIAVICNRCNSLKRDCTVDDLQRPIRYMSRC
jgi:hypothetical protein